jgi:beta-xylosidase
MLYTESASHTTALITILHFNKFITFRRFKQLSGLCVNTKSALHMAGVMISDFCAAGSCVQATGFFIFFSYEAGELAHFLGEISGPCTPFGVILKQFGICDMPGLGASGASG